jgi:hypothetical protein
MDNYFLKKQLLGEIQEAIRFKDLNIEFLELNSFIARWLLAYCTKNHVRPPNIDKLGKAAN